MKIHSISSGFTKKLHINWEGPVIITGFVGDEEDPKAARILDIRRRIRRTLSLTDIKPVIDTYEKPEDSINLSQNRDGNTFTSSSDSRESDSLVLNDPYHPSWYVSYGNSKDHTPTNENNLSSQRRDSDLDIPQRTIHGPMTSSPCRRVTISNDVQTRVYEQENINNTMDEDLFEDAQDNQQSSSQIDTTNNFNTSEMDISEDTQDTEITQTSNTTTTQNAAKCTETIQDSQTTPSQQSQNQDITVYDYPDNRYDDPTYRLPSDTTLAEDTTIDSNLTVSILKQPSKSQAQRKKRPPTGAHGMCTRSSARKAREQETQPTESDQTRSDETDQDPEPMQNKNTAASMLRRFIHEIGDYYRTNDDLN